LVRFGDPELGLRDHLDTERRQQPAKLAQLALVVRREHEARDAHPAARRPGAPQLAANAARCAAISSRMPRSASVTSPSLSPRVKGVPSAVPCSSTKPPAPVITTFMSVSQPESSAEARCGSGTP